MAAHRYPYNVVGNRVWGSIIPPRGLVHGIHIDTNALEPYSPLLGWTHTLQTGQTATEAAVRIYREGEWIDTVIGASQAAIPLAYAGNMTRIEIEPATIYESQHIDSSAGFAVRPVGKRAEITWTECTADDFEAYLLYWDAGDEGTTDVLIGTFYGAGITRTISPELTNGTTYQFALATRDVLGNVSSIGTVASITAETEPLALTGVDVAYDSETRIATITGSHPASQHDDVVGAVLYDNYIPAWGLSEYVNVDYQLRRDFQYGTAAVSLTTRALHEGQWRFALRAIDKYGTESTYSVITLNLTTTPGGTLEEASTIPLVPLNVGADPTADAGMVISWDHAGADVTAYNIYVERLDV